MSKLSIMERERKRRTLRLRHYNSRKLLKGIIKCSESKDEKELAFDKLCKLPRNSSMVRKRNRCSVTGRGKGVYRMFGLSRMILRELAAKGELPGVMKSSW